MIAKFVLILKCTCCTTLLICFVSIVAATAQTNAPERKGYLEKRFMFSAGMGLWYIEPLTAYTVNPEPRLVLMNRFADVSFSFALPATIGICPDTSSSFFATVPGLLELNLGHLATKEFLEELGLNLGAGYGLYKLGNGWLHGPAFSGAIRLWIANRSFSLRYQLAIPQTKNNMLMHGFSLSTTIGKWIGTNKKYGKVSRFVKPYQKRGSGAGKGRGAKKQNW